MLSEQIRNARAIRLPITPRYFLIRQGPIEKHSTILIGITITQIIRDLPGMRQLPSFPSQLRCLRNPQQCFPVADDRMIDSQSTCSCAADSNKGNLNDCAA